MTFRLPFAALCLTASTFVASAAAPDLTASLEYIANPAASLSWNGRSQPKCREAMCILPYRDRLYVGVGNTEVNPGPCPVIAVDPVNGTFENEYSAGTEAFDYFKILSDGRLWAGAIDPHENDAHYGHYFVRDPDGTWNRHGNLPTLYSQCSLPTHLWDMAEWNGEVYFAGYGVASVDPATMTARARVTTSGYYYRQYYAGGYMYNGVWNVSTWSSYYRLQAFLAFEDTLFVVPNNYYRGDYPDKCQAVAYRMDKGDTYMHCVTNTVEALFPGLTNNDTNDLELTTYYRYGNNRLYTTIWHPHPFKDRVVYAVSQWDQDGNCGQVYVPLFAASAHMTEDNEIASTRIEIEERFHPIDFYEHDGRMYMLAFRYNPATKDMTHGVWSSEDGVSFSKLFTFDYQQVMSSLAYYNGDFYFGSASMRMSMPTNVVTYAATTDYAGRIYRVPYPLEPVRIVPSQTAALAVAEGGSSTVSFSLSAKPASNLVCAVELRDACPLAVSPATLTFTPSNWSAPQTVTVTYPDDDSSEVPATVVFCRGGSAATTAGIPVVGTNDDFPPELGTPAATPAHASASVSVPVNSLGVTSSFADLVLTLHTDSARTDATLAASATARATATGTQTFALSGLEPETTYHARLVATAENGLATTNASLSFTTLAFPFEIDSATASVSDDGTSVAFAAALAAPYASGATATLAFDGTVVKTWTDPLAAGANERTATLATTPGKTIAWTFTVAGSGETRSASGRLSTTPSSTWFPLTAADAPVPTNLLGGAFVHTAAAAAAASNAVVEATLELFSTPSVPAVADDTLTALVLVRGTAGANGFAALTALGWVALTNGAVSTASGARHTLRAEFSTPTGGVRSVRYLLDGSALASGPLQWLPLRAAGSPSTVRVIGPGRIASLRGIYVAALDGAPGGLSAPDLSQGADGVPPLALEDGTLRIRLASTQSGVVYTAFTAEALGEDFLPALSVTGDGSPVTLVLSAASESLFVVVTASNAAPTDGQTLASFQAGP